MANLQTNLQKKLRPAGRLGLRTGLLKNLLNLSALPLGPSNADHALFL